jgi:hypothetical protein
MHGSSSTPVTREQQLVLLAHFTLASGPAAAAGAVATGTAKAGAALQVTTSG